MMQMQNSTVITDVYQGVCSIINQFNIKNIIS